MCSHILCPSFKTLKSDMLCRLFLGVLSQCFFSLYSFHSALFCNKLFTYHLYYSMIFFPWGKEPILFIFVSLTKSNPATLTTYLGQWTKCIWYSISIICFIRLCHSQTGSIFGTRLETFCFPTKIKMKLVKVLQSHLSVCFAFLESSLIYKNSFEYHNILYQ